MQAVCWQGWSLFARERCGRSAALRREMWQIDKLIYMTILNNVLVRARSTQQMDKLGFDTNAV